MSPNYCLCMLAFKVFTLIHFHLCVCWHFFIFVSLVMEDGSSCCRTQHHHSPAKLRPQPLPTDRPFCAVLYLTCTTYLYVTPLSAAFRQLFSLHYAIETCLCFPFRGENELQVYQEIEARVSDMSRGKEMKTKNIHILLPLSHMHHSEYIVQL